MAIRADDVDFDRDAALVQRFQDGDEEAFVDLYQRYYGRLRRYCVRRLGDAHDADEAAQEALIRAYRALPGFAGDRRFYPWLRVIATNVCTDMRKRKPAVPLADPDRGDVVVESVFEVLDREQVRAALAQLNPRHQTALSLWAEGYQSRDIADELGCTPGAADVTLHRARQSFRRRFLALTGDGKLGAVGFLPAVAGLSQRWRVRLGTRVAQYSDLASPLAAKVAAGAIALSVVGGAAAVDSRPGAPRPTPPPPAVVRTTPAAVVAPESAPARAPAAPAGRANPLPSPAAPAPPSTAVPAPEPSARPLNPRAEIMSADEADRESEGSPVDVKVPGVVGLSLDPKSAAGELFGAQGES